ncbi:MAG: hypothetical protein VXW65_02325 [Pseudomonadota bacterium]|nr:hypothetical protein [Pseudomonadota bacterium]
MIVSRNSSSAPLEPLSTGTKLARCIGLLDLGTQHDEYQGKETIQRKVRIVWELPNEQHGDGVPFVIGKNYTLSLGDKATLRSDLVAWRNGKEFTEQDLDGFDLRAILGKGCFLSVGQNRNKKAVVNSVMALPKDTPIPEQFHPTQYLSFEDPATVDLKLIDAQPDFIKNMIRSSPEFEPYKTDVPDVIA